MGMQEEYQRRVAAGDLTADAAQTAVLPLFDTLQTQIDQAATPRKRGFAGMFGAGAAPTPAKGLYLWGGVGRGKSMLMDMFVDSLATPRKRRVHFHAFMQEIHAALHEARKTGVKDAIAPVAKQVANEVQLLAFDEMQINDIADAMIVGRLFEKLFAAGVTVVTTSNRPPDDLYKNGLNRQLFLPFIDILKERMTVHDLVSPTDFRQNILAGTPVYFSPIDAEARARIAAVWQELTGGEAEPLLLSVNGREVEIPAFRNGVARAGFFDLCGRPLGAADYLELAKAVRVLVLENVPYLSRSNFNEAKRFVTLIDALYEAGVRLICSAATVPEMLYIEGEGVFEFERTASRLREMQGADWGAEI